MEEGVGTICFATGMAAIAGLFSTLLRKGDHLVASSYLFGNTASLMSTYELLGIELTFVDATDAANVRKAIRPATKMVFVETIANPVTQVADLVAIGELCREKKLIYVVDNTMTSPYLFIPKRVGAAFSVNSLTKSIGGHGDALGGAVTDLGEFDWGSYPHIFDLYKKGDPKTWALMQIRKKGLRDFGGSLSPDNAHRISVGAETLALRLDRACSNAKALAEYLSKHPKVKHVYYPGLADHPEHDRADTLFLQSGALLSFVLVDGLDPLEAMDKLEIVISSSNLGDNRTLAIPVAKTIFFELGAEKRKEMGIDESLIRVSVGIEDFPDLRDDFARALS
ncbi:MAG: aminotransferase class I/II-fold pyridoxal phosphate-dependent enzyme, partial [Spirochaetia bacterium]|nr:aminotransferase class I/II-fold pyridoxal phosphate-dependent enzyme [Spirochaetia bacterium]